MSSNLHFDRAVRALRFSVIAVWLGTALACVIDEASGSPPFLTGRTLLMTAGITQPAMQTFLIFSGLLADALIGMWMLLRPGPASYLAALLLMCVMTVFATYLHPELWLHPLGPLLKNIPIAAALWLLLQTSSRVQQPESEQIL